MDNSKNVLHACVSANKSLKIDACGMQCPGPILKLAEAIEGMSEGEVVEISTNDSGFALDIDAWCKSTGNTLMDLEKIEKKYVARIQKGGQTFETEKNGQTMVVFSNDLDKALASFIIANGAAASGKKVTMFFTFWGLNILRKPQNVKVKKGLIDKMFGIMMPKGESKLTLSKMHMAGAGTWMMKQVMKHKQILSLSELIESAKNSGVKFIACTMSMDVMGIKAEELIEGVELGGVAKYIAESNSANSNLFI